jgi:hypothetical protein
MTRSFQTLILLPLLAGALLSAAATPLKTKHDDFSAGDLNESLWMPEMGPYQALFEFDGRLVLLRDPLCLDPDQTGIRISTFSKSEEAVQFDIRVSARVPRKIIAPWADFDDAVAVGLGFFVAERDDRFIGLLLEDSAAGRHFVRISGGGLGVDLKRIAVPADAGSTVLLRVFRAPSGRLTFMWRKPEDTAWRKIFGGLPTSTVSGAVGPSILRPFLMGRALGSVPCPPYWNVSLDNFTLNYQRAAD